MKKPKAKKKPSGKGKASRAEWEKEVLRSTKAAFIEHNKMAEDFLADVPKAKAPDLRPPMKRDALEEGYHALEDSRIDHAKALRELSGDMGRLAHLIALYLPSERREDFKREAADILNRKQEQS